MKITVIICTHNPRQDYLARVLESLKKQSMPKSEWTLLVVDNGSSKPISVSLDLSWHPNGKIVQEGRLGIAFARLRGIHESRCDLLVFVDDDNVLDENYLAETHHIAETWPQLGAWGCTITPEFEIPPARNLRPYLKFLALREVQAPRWSNVWDCREAEPWGAGLTIRRKVANAYVEFSKSTKLRVNGRSGNILLSGEDTEIAYVTCSIGLGVGVFPSLKLLHLISKRRLTDDYIVKIVQGTTTSSLILFYKWGQIEPESPISPLALGKLIKATLFERGLERRVSIASYRAKIAARNFIRKSKRGDAS